MNPETTTPLPVHVSPRGLEALKTYEKEIATYRQELPRLLQEGKAGQFALLKDNQILGMWPTWAEAVQDGRKRFGIEPICVMKIDPRDPERYALLDAHLSSQCQS